MKVFKYGSNTRLCTVNVNRYKIDWEKDGASSLEKKFRDFVRPFWFNQIILFQFRLPGSLMRLDFLNVTKRLGIEVSSSYHNTYNPFFMNNSRNNYLASIKRDLAKSDWCAQNNIKLLTLYEEDLDKLSPKYILEKFNIDII